MVNNHSTNQIEKSQSFELMILILKAILGAVMLCIGFANIYNLVDWSHDYNQALVYFGFFLWMSLSGMLFWSGVKGIITKMKEASE